MYKQAQTSRTGAAAALAQGFRDHTFTLDDALNLAHDRIDDVGGRDDAIGFSAAVLAAAVEVNDKLPQGDEFLIFWRRIGRLAFWAALRARARGDTEDALALVEAGPARWKTESYWIRYPDHDALAAYILCDAGKKNEAVRRLRSRPELTGMAEEAYQRITGEQP